MANEPFADFMDYLITNLNSKSTFATNSDNIIIGETINLAERESDFFPRVELLIKKMKDDGYVDQRIVDQSFRFTAIGHIHRAADDTTKEDMFTLIRFARETKSIIYGANTDRRLGNTICDGFKQIGGFTEIDMDFEMFPYISSFLIEGEAEIELEDVFTNN